MDCILIQKGYGPGASNGRPKKDQTRSVRDFIVDNGVYYTLVFKHVKECTKCDPAEILKAYLKRRMTDKSGWMTSGMLVQLAIKYEKHCNKIGVPLPDELVNEFMWRSGNIHLMEHAVSAFDLFRGLVLCHRKGVLFVRDGDFKAKALEPLVRAFIPDRCHVGQDPSDVNLFPNPEEINNLVRTLEVLHA